MAAPQKIGRYTIKRELGRGGMATVYLALDPQTRQHVALKVLPRQFLHDPTFRARFEREARTVIKVRHPAIVPVLDFGEADEQPFLVMHYMAGGSLQERIAQGPISLDEAARIVARIAGALEAAHAMGIVHRDLKPGNILFDDAGDAYLADFGIVKVAEATHSFTGSAVIGTPAYMSPEQVHGERTLDGRSDTYTLGVILFEMLTGRSPYKADTPAKMMMAHVLEPVPRILEFKPDLPAGAETIITKAMAKSPDERYQRVGGMASDLGALAGGRTLVAPATQAAAASPGRRRTLALILGALGLVGLALLVVAGGVLAMGLGVGSTPVPGITEPAASPAANGVPGDGVNPSGSPATAAIRLTRAENNPADEAGPEGDAGEPILEPTLRGDASPTAGATLAWTPTSAPTSTPRPPVTGTPLPPPTSPPPATATPPPPATNTPVPPPTNTPVPPPTNTPVPPPTNTVVVPTPTNTVVIVTATRTPPPPTSTPFLPTPTPGSDLP